MVNILIKALEDNASSKTRKYFLDTAEGKNMINDLITTVAELINADYSDSIIAHNGAAFDQTDYKVFGNVNALWEASRIYPSAKDLLRRSNELDIFTVDLNNIPDGRVLTPIEVDIVIDRYNENQREPLKITQLSGTKGVEFWAISAFIDGTSICSGNMNGSIPAEVSVCFGIENPLGKSAIIDEVNDKAVGKWLLANQ